MRASPSTGRGRQPPMITGLRKILGYQMTIAEWIGTALILGIPYLVDRCDLVAHPHRPPQRARGHRPRRVASRLHRVLAGAVVLRRLHDLNHDRLQNPASPDAPPVGMPATSPPPTRWTSGHSPPGAANVIMQLSWPEVGHGVVESKVDSGNLMKHPWKRARTTFQYLAVAILGSAQDRARIPRGGRRRTSARQVHAAKPVQYNAFDRELQMWVAGVPFRRPGGHLSIAARAR